MVGRPDGCDSALPHVTRVLLAGMLSMAGMHDLLITGALTVVYAVFLAGRCKPGQFGINTRSSR